MERKYHKYKTKYLLLKKQKGGRMPGSAAAPVLAAQTADERIISNIFADLEKIRKTIDWFGEYGRDDYFDKEPPMIAEKDNGRLVTIYIHDGHNLLFMLFPIGNNVYEAVIPNNARDSRITWESLKSKEDITNNLLVPIRAPLTDLAWRFLPSSAKEFLRFNENDTSPHITIRNMIKSNTKEAIIRWAPSEPKFKGSVIGEKEPDRKNYPNEREFNTQYYEFSDKVPLSQYLKACKEVEGKLKNVLKEMLSKITAEGRSIVPTAVEDITWSYLG